MKDLEAELMNSYSLMDSGGNIELFRGEDGSVTMRPSPMPYLRSPMRQAEPQSSLERTVEELPAAVGGLAGGATAATVGLPGDIAGLAAGAYKALFPDEGEGRLEAFTNTLSDISDKYGSGAVKGYLRDQAEKVGASDAQIKVLEEAMALGEFGGVGGLAKGLVTKGPQILSKAGDFIEGAGEGAKARMGGATLTSGVDPDPLIAAAGDAVAKFRAPTEKQPGVIAFHGSGADFDEFKLEKIGTGEGAQAYGYGLYFTDSEDIAKFYRDSISRGRSSIVYDGDAVRSARQADGLTDREMILDTIAGEMASFDQKPENVIARKIKNLKQEIDDPVDISAYGDDAEAQELKDAIIASSKRELEIYESIDPDKFGRGKMYKVGLEPKPEDMLDYQTTFADQPKNVQDALKAIGYHVETDATGMKNATAQVELAMKRPMPVILDSLKGRITGKIRAGEQDPGRADKILSEKLLEQGVPGIKYRAAGSRAASVDAADAEMNYVIFDDKMVKILEKYGIVGPVAITGAAAPQQEGESDGRSA